MKRVPHGAPFIPLPTLALNCFGPKIRKWEIKHTHTLLFNGNFVYLTENKMRHAFGISLALINMKD